MDPKPINMLLLEDDPADARLLQMMLRQAAPGQFELTVATRLSEALEQLRKAPFDLILTDLDLPDSQGLGTFLQIHTQAADTPIVVLSGRSDEEAALTAVQKGAQDCLTKGQTNGSNIARALRHALERHRQGKVVKPAGAARGKVLAFIGAKGGVGTTTVALNVAAALAMQKAQVILCELHPSFSTLSLLLGLTATPLGNLRQIFNLPEGKINAAEISSRLANAPGGFRVLYGPQKLEEFKELEPGQCLHLLEELSALTEYLILDLPTQPSEASRIAIQRADRVALVVERDPMSVACGSVVLEGIKALGGPAKTVAVVVNRAALAMPMRLPEARTKLGCELVGVIPPAAEAFLKAQQVSAPLVLSQSRQIAAIALIETAGRLTAARITTARLD